jgi:hypothetical protein
MGGLRLSLWAGVPALVDSGTSTPSRCDAALCEARGSGRLSGQRSRNHLAYLIDFEQEAVVPRLRVDDMDRGTAWKVTRQIFLLGQRVETV